MVKIPRDTLKTTMRSLLNYIQKVHVMGPEIYHELYVTHKPVLNLCTTREYFMIFSTYHISYVMDHVIQDVDLTLIGRRVEEVTLYDDFIEYEAARVKAMSKVANDKQTGLNLN